MTGSAVALTLPAVSSHAAPSLLRIYRLEAWYEFLKMLRQPAYAVPTLGFPVMFYLLFGILLGGRGPRGLNLEEYLIASYGAFGVVGAAMFGFGVGIASERAQGWLLLKRVSPMPPAALLTAKVIMSAVFGLLIIVLMGMCGVLLGGVRSDAGELARAGARAGGRLGALLPDRPGDRVSGQPRRRAGHRQSHSPAAGVSRRGWRMPIEVMPAAVRSFAQVLPQYHLGQLALGAIGRASDPDPVRHVAGAGRRSPCWRGLAAASGASTGPA